MPHPDAPDPRDAEVVDPRAAPEQVKPSATGLVVDVDDPDDPDADASGPADG